MKKINSKQKGFTLIEFLVAGTVFVVILTIVISIIVRSMQVHSRIVAAEAVNDEARYALDTISRAVRVSKIESGGASLVLSGHPTKGNITYTLAGGVIQENGEDITSSNITVDILNFTVSGIGFEGFGIGAQPKVTLTIKAKSANPVFAADSEILVQTTIEQKALDMAPVVEVSSVNFALDTNYIEEDSVNGTSISGGVGTLQDTVVWVRSSFGAGGVNSVIFDDVHDKYIAGGGDVASNAVVWECDIATGVWSPTVIEGGYVYSVAFDNVNNKYIAGGKDSAGKVTVWVKDLAVGSWVKTILETKGRINDVIYDSVHNKYVAVGERWGLLADDSYAWECNAATGVWSGGVAVSSPGGLEYMRKVIFDPVRNQYVAGGSSGSFNAATWRKDILVGAWEIAADAGGVNGTMVAIAYDPVNSKYIACGQNVWDAVVWIKDLATGIWTNSVIDIAANIQIASAIMYDPVKNKYVVGGNDKKSGIYESVVWEYDVSSGIWAKEDLDSGAAVHTVSSVAFDSIRNKYIVGGEYAGEATIWENDNIQYPIAQPYYITTNDSSQIDTSVWTAIDNITITAAEPANTSLKYLVSFDGRATWKYWDGAAWIDSSLANLQTEGMTQAEVEAIVKLQWSGAGGFQAGTTLTLDFAVDLMTTDASITPSVDEIAVNYES